MNAMNWGYGYFPNDVSALQFFQGNQLGIWLFAERPMKMRNEKWKRWKNEEMKRWKMKKKKKKEKWIVNEIMNGIN